MAIFNDEAPQDGNSETIIGSSVKVDGNFKSDGNIIVDGIVQGSLKTKSNLTIGSTAKIKAEVTANNLYLSGEIRGNVKVNEKAELKSSAKIIGNLETKILTVEEGALINGKCTMGTEENVTVDNKDNKKVAQDK
ncbi:MAG: bactofilin family protein [Candidatus Kerfeldbacteria bacterium]|jgi:cytoskeletal protein CcmA (bactofilin family)